MTRVRVAGLKRTKNDIVVEQIKDVLKATSLSELIFRSLDSAKQLERLNIFRRVSVKLDTDKRAKVKRTKGVEPSPEVGVSRVTVTGKDSIEVLFLVEERGWLSSSVGASAGTQSGDAVS